MDHRLRELERRAKQGDPEAAEHLAYAECRLGQHILRVDQIITSDDWHSADEDAGCCQCGNELYTAQDLCSKGHHHWYHNSWSGDLIYRCVRSGWTPEQQAAHRAKTDAAVHDRDWETFANLEAEYRAWQNENPYKSYGCKAALQGDEACSRGMHFLHITPAGRECRNPTCNYSEADACDHKQYGRHVTYDVENREVARCNRCQQAFYDANICAIFGHKPDEVVDNPCTRVDCSHHQQGMSLYEALAAASRAGYPLRAVCRQNNISIAEANGWNLKLKALGIKKPKQATGSKGSKWGLPRHQIQIRYDEHNPVRVYPDYPPIRPNGRHRPRFRRWEDYNNISESLKTQWAGKWYPVMVAQEQEA